jgi:hypothetical protein
MNTLHEDLHAILRTYWAKLLTFIGARNIPNELRTETIIQISCPIRFFRMS